MINKGLVVFLLCVTGLICFIAPMIAAGLFIGTAIYVWFNMANPKQVPKETEEEEEEEEEFEDPAAKMYRRDVDKAFKPGFEDDPKWQEKAREVRKEVEELRKKQKQEEKDEWKDEEDKAMDENIKKTDSWWRPYS